MAELEKLRRQGLTVTQILPHFPEHTRRQIEDQLRERQIFISRPPIPVSDPLTNAIRQRAFAVGMTLAELGRRAGTGAYFHFDRPSGASPEKAAAAAKVLGCELVIEWEPLT